jgi:hypothetical protein
MPLSFCEVVERLSLNLEKSQTVAEFSPPKYLSIVLSLPKYLSPNYPVLLSLFLIRSNLSD